MLSVPTFKFALTEDLITYCKKVNKDHNEFLPTRADSEATGWDVRCAQPGGVDLKQDCYFKIPLGFRVFSPAGWWLKLSPRSSSFIKKNIHALYGVIDETFSDQMCFCGQYSPDFYKIIDNNSPVRIEFGERIGQIIPVPRYDMNVETISENVLEELVRERGAARVGGFGSTGDK